MIFYHYTANDTLMKILEKGKFKPSFFKPMDTAYGEGWYFTDLHPDITTDAFLCQQLWMSPQPTKSRCYLEFDIDPSLMIACRANVYLLPKAYVNDKSIKLHLTYTNPRTNGLVIVYRRYGFKPFI